MDVVTLPITELCLRLGVATLGGALIGLDRDLHRKSAGLRTFALVAVGTAGVTISAVAAVAPSPENVGRVVQGVLTGIGFLGAGVILRRPDRPRVTGLTTAASVWFTACHAVICGLGEYALAALSFGIAFTLLIGGRGMERWIERRAYGKPNSDEPDD